MSAIIQSLKNRFTTKSHEPDIIQLVSHPIDDSSDRYDEWIRKKIRRECFLDYYPSLSHWVPFLMTQRPFSVEEQLEHTWSPVNKSININIKEDNPFFFHRNPVTHSTDVARGKQGYSHGVHIWKIIWPVNERGTHAVIGVTTDKSMLQYDSYVPLVGMDDESWGWDIVNMVAVHNNGLSNLRHCRPFPQHKKRKSREETPKVPETVFVVLDMDKGCLSFLAANRFVGVAHTGLAGRTLYPAVSAVWGHCEVGLKYNYNLVVEPPSLMSLSLFVAKKLLKYHCQYHQYDDRSWFSKQIQKRTKKTSQSLVVRKLQIPELIKTMLVTNHNSVDTV